MRLAIGPIAGAIGIVLLATGARAQCPDGSPPPCVRARSALPGKASLRLIASSPLAGTVLEWQNLVAGIPLHVVIEHSVQQLPRGNTPVFLAFVDLAPADIKLPKIAVLTLRTIDARPTQLGFDVTLQTRHVVDGKVTVRVVVGFRSGQTSDSTSSLIGADWAASISLEFPVRNVPHMSSSTADPLRSNAGSTTARNDRGVERLGARPHHRLRAPRSGYFGTACLQCLTARTLCMNN